MYTEDPEGPIDGRKQLAATITLRAGEDGLELRCPFCEVWTALRPRTAVDAGHDGPALFISMTFDSAHHCSEVEHVDPA